MRESKIVSIIREKGPIDMLSLAEELAKVSPNSKQAQDYLEWIKRDLTLSARYEHFWVENLYAHITPIREAGRVMREKVGKRWVYSAVDVPSELDQEIRSIDRMMV